MTTNQIIQADESGRDNEMSGSRVVIRQKEERRRLAKNPYIHERLARRKEMIDIRAVLP